MKVNNAIETREYCDILRKNLRKLRYNPDLHKMLHNIEEMATNLSKKEVEKRRTKYNSDVEILLSDINTAIEHLEKFILLAQLMD